jgi:hypothetical protein
MPSQGYERVRCVPSPEPLCRSSRHALRANSTLTAAQVANNDDADSPVTSQQQWPPASPPPSFRSRASSPTARRLLSDDPLAHSEDRTPDRTPDRTQDRTLADTFDSDSDDDEDADGRDDRQRLMRGNPQDDAVPPPPGIQRRVTELPTFNTQTPASGRVYGGGNGGVWANLSAKPTRGEDVEEKPPVRTTRSHPHTPC